jgi:hypothetical protein
MRRVLAASILAAGVSLSAPALAADLPMPAPAPTPMTISSGWHFEATIDGWAPSVWAGVGIRQFPVANVYANVFTILRHLEGLVPVSAVAYNDTFVVGADIFWVRTAVNAKFGRADGPFGGVNADLTANETFFTGYAGLRVPIASPALNLYAIAGARFVNVNATLNLNANIDNLGFSASQGKTWADPIGGVFARYRFNDKWGAKFEADGGGYSGSATAQVYSAISYNWTPNFTSSAGLRYLYVYEQTSANVGNGSFRFRQTTFGPEFDTSINF